MWYEAFVISTSIAGVLAFLIYFLAVQIAGRIPTAEDMVEAAVAKFGLEETTSGSGGRQNEGFVDKILAIPGVQAYIGNMLNKQMGGLVGP